MSRFSFSRSILHDFVAIMADSKAVKSCVDRCNERRHFFVSAVRIRCRSEREHSQQLQKQYDNGWRIVRSDDESIDRSTDLSEWVEKFDWVSKRKKHVDSVPENCGDETEAIEHMMKCLSRRYQNNPVAYVGTLNEALKESFKSAQLNEVNRWTTSEVWPFVFRS